jgi:hypothetical protein
MWPRERGAGSGISSDGGQVTARQSVRDLHGGDFGGG